MAGTPQNTVPGSLASADPEQAVGRLVQIIRQERPHVITAYNETGTYGHPDHLAVNRITLQAFGDAGRGDRYPDLRLPPWQPRKLYYQAIPVSRIRKMGEFMEKRAKQLGVDPETMGTEDQKITTWIDIREVLETKFSAIRCHRSQIGENSFFDQFPESQRRVLFGFECFVWVAGQDKPNSRETDLFEGISRNEAMTPVEPIQR
jgi:LmbE family N-acetylglucosaminyl deacetylase